MLKASLLLVAILAVAVLAQPAPGFEPVCLPWVFQWQREQQFQPLANNGYGGFDIAEEWYDYNNQNFHFRIHVWEANGEEVMTDLILIGGQSKLYTVNATKGSGSVTCTVQAAAFPPSTPCLLANATVGAQFFIAGDVFVNEWRQQEQFGNETVYTDIGLTAETNVPINSRSFYAGEGATFEMYFNYALNLDADAFHIPSICPSGFTTITEEHPGFFTEARLRRKFRWLRNAN